MTHHGVTARLLLAKNPAGWAELLDLLADGDDPVVIGINARVADGHDPSWLWDVPFERLAGRLAVATGERCLDLAMRLQYAGVAHRTTPDQLEALQLAGAADVQYVGNYTAFQELRRLLTSTDAAAPAPSAPLAPPSLRRAVRPAGRDSALRVVVVHPDLLGTYGDGGNGVVLARRAGWRGMGVDLVLADSSRPLPESGDVYCLGGGEDGPQVLAAGAWPTRPRALPMPPARWSSPCAPAFRWWGARSRTPTGDPGPAWGCST